MNLEEITIKIQEKLSLIFKIQSINLHIQDFRTKESKPTYIEFKLLNKVNEENVFELYKRFNNLIKKNHPLVQINYNNPYANHPENILRRIKIEIEPQIKKPEDKKQELIKVAYTFDHLLDSFKRYKKESKS